MNYCLLKIFNFTSVEQEIIKSLIGNFFNLKFNVPIQFEIKFCLILKASNLSKISLLINFILKGFILLVLTCVTEFSIMLALNVMVDSSYTFCIDLLTKYLNKAK